MYVMSKMLSDGQTSRIYRKLVYETGLALTAFGGGNFIEQPASFSAVAIVNPGKSPEEVEKALIAEFDKLKTAGHHRTRAAARQEPVRARLHPRPPVHPGEGRAARPCRGDPGRHRDGRRRVRHLPEDDARRRAARRQEVFRAGRRGGDAHHAARGSGREKSMSKAISRRCGIVRRADACEYWRRRPRRRAQVSRLAARQSAAAAAGQAGEVPAVRNPQAAQRHAGRAGQPERAAGGERAA